MTQPIDALRETDPARRVIVALDKPTEDEALRLADALRPAASYVKVGLQLYVAAGPSVVRKLRSLGFSVFLDLKLHDIPNTMGRAIESQRSLGVRMSTVHAAAHKGVAAAAEAKAGNDAAPMALLAVTVLTSHAEGELSQLFATDLDTEELVLRLAKNSIDQGADGLVASPREILALREALGPEPLLVIPGIRPTGSASADQSRVATPARAIADGADFLVVGRPITAAESPADAFRRIVDEIATAV